MQALVGSETGGYRLESGLDIPAIPSDSILCRVHAVALNPHDAKVVDYSNAPGSTGGCDFAGTIVQVGRDVQRLKEGDRVLCLTWGMDASDKTAGAFAEYALATEDLSCRIPETLSFEEACSMGLTIATAGMALFQAAPGLGLSLQGGNGKTILVSGGATATGTMATQLLKMAGYTPIVTCSPANNALCESYGAAACFDYHLPTCGADIRVYTDNSLEDVLDCATDPTTMKMCYEAIGADGGSYIAIEAIATAVKYTRRDVRADWLMSPSLLGTPVRRSGTYGRPSTPEHRQFGRRLFLLAEEWLRDGLLKHHPLDVRAGGLAEIPKGMDEVRRGQLHAKKIVLQLMAH